MSARIPEEEIEKIVWLQYPKDPEEFHCARKRHALNELRQYLRVKLRNYEQTGEGQILEHPQTTDGNV